MMVCTVNVKCWYPVRAYKVPGLKTLDLSDNGMVNASREIWDGDCNSQRAESDHISRQPRAYLRRHKGMERHHDGGGRI